jgi:hypothetical protein
MRRETLTFFGQLIVAGQDEVHRGAGQGFTQEMEDVLIDIDHVPKTVGVVKRAVLALPAVPVLAVLLAALIGIDRNLQWIGPRVRWPGRGFRR